MRKLGAQREYPAELNHKRDITVREYYTLILTVKFLRAMPKYGLAESKLDDLIDRALSSSWLYADGNVENFRAADFLAHLKHDESASHIMEPDTPPPTDEPRFVMPPQAVLDKLSPVQRMSMDEKLRQQKLRDNHMASKARLAEVNSVHS